tara:strand:+ start:276 stop:590 length:315 start_codon:yes stop_codon:yes gene_type:complete
MIRRKIICADGYEISLQASKGHYCTPKRDDADVYDSLELLAYGYDELLCQYVDFNDNDGRDRIGSYVPVEIVLKVLLKHGGAIQGEIPPFSVTSHLNKIGVDNE